MQRKMVSAFFHLCRRFRFLCRRFFFLDLPFGRNFQLRRLSPTRKSSAEISAEGRSRYGTLTYIWLIFICKRRYKYTSPMDAIGKFALCSPRHVSRTCEKKRNVGEYLPSPLWRTQNLAPKSCTIPTTACRAKCSCTPCGSTGRSFHQSRCRPAYERVFLTI